MTHPVSYACDPGARYCECGHCQLTPARQIDLAPIEGLNRATFTLSMFLILLCAVLAFIAIGSWNTEQVHTDIIKARSV